MPTCLFAHPGAELFGSDRMLIESVVAARERGYECVVTLPETGPLVAELRAVGATVAVEPGLVLRKALLRPRNWPKLVGDIIRGFSSAWRLISRTAADVIYVNTITIPLWPVVARLRRRPVITHVHEAEASGSRLVNRVLYAPHAFSQRLLVNSQFSLETIRSSLPRLTQRAHVVYNGVASPDDAPAPRAAIEGAFRILYVGRLSARKGPDVVVEAAHLVKDAGFEVHVGLLGSVFAGYEWFEEELRASVARWGMIDDVEFHGFNTNVWPYLAEADVLVVPSRVDEPFGNTAVEGILARRPVITTDTSGLREAAGGYPTAQLVPTDDAFAVAAALRRVMSDWGSVTAQVEGSRRRALERHAPEVYRASVADHLDVVAARGKP